MSIPAASLSNEFYLTRLSNEFGMYQRPTLWLVSPLVHREKGIMGYSGGKKSCNKFSIIWCMPSRSHLESGEGGGSSQHLLIGNCFCVGGAGFFPPTD